MSLPVQQGEPELEKQKEIAVIKMREDLRDPSLPRAVVLDLSPVNFLDTVGVKTIRNVRVDATLDDTSRQSPPLTVLLTQAHFLFGSIIYIIYLFFPIFFPFHCIYYVTFIMLFYIMLLINF